LRKETSVDASSGLKWQDDRSLDCGEDSTSILVVQDHVEKATVHRQPLAIVIDEAKRLEPVHEMTDP